MERKLRSGSGGLMSGKTQAGFSTPYFLVEEKSLLHNLEILKRVQEEAGCKILLAQKAFSMFYAYPLIRKYLAGTTASGLYEARLGHECFGGETHVFSPAYREEEFEEILQYADDLVFNSPRQVRLYGERAKKEGKSIGLRINPSAPLRKAMPSTIPARRAPGWELPWRTLRKVSCPFWTAFTSILSVNRERKTWRSLSGPLRKSLENTCIR